MSKGICGCTKPTEYTATQSSGIQEIEVILHQQAPLVNIFITELENFHLPDMVQHSFLFYILNMKPL